MIREELNFDLLEVLKDVADKFLPALVQKAREVLMPRDLKLFDYVFTRYYQEEAIKGRWYDKYHIPLAVLFAGKAVKLGQAPRETVPGAILHDIGYAFIDPELRVGGESKENLQTVHLSRILHMQKVAGPAVKILRQNGGFSYDKISRIIDVIVSHDNGSIGIPITEEPLFLSVRDADRTLPVHLISFYKDWLGITGQREDFSLLDLFRSRMVTFYDESDSAPQIWGKPEKLAKEDEFSYCRVPYTLLAKEWRDRQFEARWQEIQGDVLKDENSFRRYAEQHIRSEIAVGRG